MKITIRTAFGEKKVFHFIIDQIIKDFDFMEDPYEKCRYIDNKLNEAIILDGCSKKANFISKIKIAYLLRFRRLDLILNGILKMAYDDLETEERMKNTSV
jgi:hypothetical protein